MRKLIRIEKAEKIYTMGSNQVRALNGIDLEIGKGEFVAVVGRSGSGKSTLMNIIGCLDTLTRGEYFLDGQRVLGLSDRKLSRIRSNQIGFIFQGFNLIPTLTAYENVELLLSYRRFSREKKKELCQKALASVGLEGRQFHRPGELSGGQQQRVAIARAIASSPPIILADEPTGNLDSVSGQEVIDILKKLNAQGKTVILITHDNATAKQANRIIRIADGRIVEDSGR